MEKFRVLCTMIFIKLFSHCKWLKDEPYNRILFRLRTGKRADLDNPKTFNEHILARKVRLDEYGLCKYTDKYGVREYVEQVIGKEYLVPCLGIWEKGQKISPADLPIPCVLKATHGSGWNAIIQDKQDIEQKISRLQKTLSQNYYYKSREKNYRDIPPRIVCEQFICPQDKRGLIDVKTYCFRGEAKFLNICYAENGKEYSGLFSLTGQSLGAQDNSRQMEVPDDALISKVISLSEQLAKPFDFVRVDFYLADEKIYFSELTFHSGGGIVPVKPETLNIQLGSYFD